MSRSGERAESGAAALVAIVIVVCGTLAALGCVDIALLGVTRARAAAAADAAALAAALLVDTDAAGVAREASELARRNGAVLVGSPEIDPDAAEVSVEVEVAASLPLTGRQAVRATATARLLA